jgi:hypothetical protein
MTNGTGTEGKIENFDGTQGRLKIFVALKKYP